MKSKSKTIILIILFMCSVMILSMTAVSAAEKSSDTNNNNNKIDVKNDAKKTVASKTVVVKKKTISTVSMSKAKSFVKKQRTSTVKNSKSSYMEAYDYRNKKMVWFKVPNTSTVDQYPAGLRLTTKSSNSKVTYKIVSSTKTKNSYNKKTNTNTTTKYTVLYNIKGSKSKVALVTTTTSKLSSSKLANKYLMPTTNSEVDNPRIVSLANSITKGLKSDDYEGKAKAIYKWVQVNIDYTLNADTSAVAILSNKGANGNYKAYCVGFSNVMGALCRAANVPTRYHAILFFEGAQYPFEGHQGHVWSEVYVNGKWVYADAATVGFTAPLGYKSYLQAMHTDPGGSYVSYTNSWNYWYFQCNHHLIGHLDTNIIKEATGVPVLEYFDLSTTVSDALTAYNILSRYASQNGYVIHKPYFFTGSSDYVNPAVFTPIYAFHYFDTTGNFLGYLILGQNGILYPALQTTTYINPGIAGIPINYYSFIR